MKDLVYPAIFHKAEEGGFWVEFPDLPGCFTQGETVEEAYNMAGDALFTWLNAYEGDLIKPSDIKAIKIKGDDFIRLIKAKPYESEDAIKFKKEEVIRKRT